MKIVNAEEFLKLPKFTLYCEYMPCVYESNMCIKLESLYSEYCHDMPDGVYMDFFYQTIDTVENKGSEDWLKKLDEMKEKGSSFPVDKDNSSRDGGYDNDQLYMIYEKEDVIAIIEMLKQCL